MVNSLKPLFLVGVLAAAAYGVFTIVGGGAPSKPPVEIEGDWGGSPLASGPGMPPPIGAAPSGLGDPVGRAPQSAGGEAPLFDPGATSTDAPPFQPLGETPLADDYATGQYSTSDNQAGLTPGVAPPLPIDVADNSAPSQQPLTDPLGPPDGSAASAGPDAQYGQTGTQNGQSDHFGNVTPQVNEFGRDAGADAGVDLAHQPSSGLAGEQSAAGGFAVAMTAVGTQLDQQKFAEAQLALSHWYGDPSLTVQQEEQLLALLDQLTGTVVYSRSHYLEPAYVARQGDTLESVASQFNVPAALLANINGISVTDSLSSGTQLKVVNGPFAASLDLNNYRLTLWLGERYAGRFAVGIGSEQPITAGEYVVETKIKNPTYYGSEVTLAADDPANPLGEYWIGLGGNVGLHGTIDPQSAGVASKEGCVRLGERDVQDVFDILTIGSRVIVHESAGPTAQSLTPQSQTGQAPTAQSSSAPGQTARF
jgi:lipoprotein-anchoring transpeptidase ErfK/SrfK